MSAICRLLKQDRKKLEQARKQTTDTAFFCRADAKAAGKKLTDTATSGYHRITVNIEKVPKSGS